MKIKYSLILAAFPVANLLSCFAPVEAAAPAMYESRVDHYRTGANLNETILNTSTVNYSDFGLLFTLPVNSPILSQTLYAPNISINNAIHNVVYITTSSASVYAYDADIQGPPLWLNKLSGLVFHTPIIDPKSNTLYLVTRSSALPPFTFKLHALDLVNGAEKFGGPVDLSATFSVDGNTLNFSSEDDIQPHAGLALANGQLIICFSGWHESPGHTYHGWVMSYNASNLQQTGVFSTISMPPAIGGGVWQSGRAPVVDNEGYIYLFVGNSIDPITYMAPSNGYDGVNNFSESLLKFDSNLNLIDWFTPGAWAQLDNIDKDLSGSGPTLIPGTNLITGGGKDGNLYLWHTDNLGKFNATDSQVAQKMAPPSVGNKTYNGSIFSGPVFWSRTSAQGGSLLFNLYSNTPIFSFAFNGNSFNTTPVSFSSATEAAGTGYKNAITLSANGGESGTGIIWEFQNNRSTNISVLRAFDAEHLNIELWNSSAYLSDSLEGNTTFVPPTIVNGKVYAPTLANQLVVYGIKNAPPIVNTPANINSALGSQINFAIQATDNDGDALVYSATGLPYGLTINANTGVITGNPSIIGNYHATVSVSDNKDGQASASYIWTISRGMIKK